MSFRDTLVTCQQCGKPFIFTVEKQRKMNEEGREVIVPDLCEACTKFVHYGGRLHGRIKWFSLEKGWGFIVQDDGRDVFVHRDGVSLTDAGVFPPLEEGQEVLYDILDTSKGPQAVKVILYHSERQA